MRNEEGIGRMGSVFVPLGAARLTANHLTPTQVRPLTPPPSNLYSLRSRFPSRYPSYGILLSLCL